MEFLAAYANPVVDSLATGRIHSRWCFALALELAEIVFMQRENGYKRTEDATEVE